MTVAGPRPLLLVSALVFGLVACGDDDNPAVDSGTPEGVTVGPEGGEVSLPAGGSLSIPAGALDEDVTILLSEVTDLPPLPAGHVQSGSAIAFTPHGLTFNAPVTLRVPYTGNATRVLRLDNGSDRTWDFVDNGVFDNGIVTVSTTHFSIYLGARRTTGTITLDGGSGSGGAGAGGVGGTAGASGAGGAGGDATDAAVDAAIVIDDAGPDADIVDPDAGTGPDDAGYDAATNISDAGEFPDAGSDAAVDERDAGVVADAGADAGECDQGCGTGEVCDAGVCECAAENWCPMDYGYDAGSPEYHCVDTQNDSLNCGGCSNVCYEGERCIRGQCEQPPCSGSEIRCDGYCTDVNSNPYQCGGCVPEGQYVETCYIGETCYCDDYGLTTCSLEGPIATCTDTGYDRLNCGQCGNTCADGNDCVRGACVPIDCGSRTLCGNECVDSPNCGSVCNVQIGELCGNGSCYQGT